MFYEGKINTVHVNRASPGNPTSMPNIGPDTRNQFSQFRSEGRNVRMIAFFHTHANLPGDPRYGTGGSRSNSPSGDDDQFQFDRGNPLGIIRAGSGYAFFSNGRAFYPSDKKADMCIEDLRKDR